MTPITTNILRASYDQGNFSFGNPGAEKTIVLIGSCRIVPFLNNLRVYNHLNDYPFELLCFDPVEMWKGPGHEVADGVNEVLKDFRFGEVHALVCEHVQYCGMLNTVRSSKQNVFDNLGCIPDTEIRLPNWNDMHIFDAETAIHDSSYASLTSEERIPLLRRRTEACKEKFLSHCRNSSFPFLDEWVDNNWLTTRLGWSSSHPSLPLVWLMFNCVMGRLGLEVTQELSEHPLCATDVYKSTGMVLTSVDYEANNWNF